MELFFNVECFPYLVTLNNGHYRLTVEIARVVMLDAIFNNRVVLVIFIILSDEFNPQGDVLVVNAIRENCEWQVCQIFQVELAV